MKEEDYALSTDTLMNFDRLLKTLRPSLGCNYAEHMVIRAIAELSCRGNKKHEVCMTDISRKLGLSKPAVTQMVSRLVERGFVRRGTSKKDRRIITVSFTDEGILFFEQGRAKTIERAKPLFDALGDEKTAALCAMLTEVNGMLTQLHGEKGGVCP